MLTWKREQVTNQPPAALSGLRIPDVRFATKLGRRRLDCVNNLIGSDCLISAISGAPLRQKSIFLI